MLKERQHLRNHAARGRRLHQDRPRARQAQRPGRLGRPRQGARLPPHARAARRGVRRVQEAGRQEEGNLRRRHRRAHRGAEHRTSTTSGSSWATASKPPPASRPRGTLTLARGGDERIGHGDRGRRPARRPVPRDRGDHRRPRRRSATTACRRPPAAKTPRARRWSSSSTTAALYRGRGVSTDTVEAGAEAYLNAVNRIVQAAGQPPSEKPAAV